MTQIRWLPAFALLVAGPAASARAEPPAPAVSASVHWHSRAVSEGLDSVPGHTAWSVSATASHAAWTMGADLLSAVGAPYREIGLWGSIDRTWGPVDVSCGLAHYRYDRASGPSSWEVFAEAAWPIHQHVTVFLGTAYDFDEVEGAFTSLGLRGTLASPGQRLTLEPFVLLGIDLGYVAGSRRPAAHHLEFGLTATWTVSDRFAASFSCHQSLACRHLQDLGGTDQTWCTAGLTASF